MARRLPLSEFPLMNTANMEEIKASFERVYGRPVMELVGRDGDFRTVVNHCKLRHIELNYGSYGASLRLQFPESAFASQIFPIKGCGEATMQGRTLSIDKDHSAVVSGGMPFGIASDAAYERLVLCVNSESLTNHLAAMTGYLVAAPPMMHASQALSHQPVRLLRVNLMFLVGQMSGTARPHPLVLAEFEQSVMSMFLHANRHNYSHLLERDSSPPPSYSTRRPFVGARSAARRVSGRATGRGLYRSPLGRAGQRGNAGGAVWRGHPQPVSRLPASARLFAAGVCDPGAAGTCAQAAGIFRSARRPRKRCGGVRLCQCRAPTSLKHSANGN